MKAMPDLGTCGCGNPVRYMVDIAGTMACNKYMRCPTREELEQELAFWRTSTTRLLDAILGENVCVFDTRENLVDNIYNAVRDAKLYRASYHKIIELAERVKRNDPS